MRCLSNIIYLFLLNYFFCAPLFGLSSKAGKIKFINHKADFGRVNKGKILNYTFHFENIGSGPLKILGISSDCGCIVEQNSKKGILARAYLPDEHGELTVGLVTEALTGDTFNIITVHTNEPLTPDRTLVIQAKIMSDYFVDQAELSFVGSVKEASHPKMIRVSPIGSFDLKIKDLLFNKNLFDVKFIQAEKDWILTVFPDFRHYSGPLKESLTIVTNSLVQKTLSIEIHGNIHGTIAWEPRFLEFGQLQHQNQSRRFIRLNTTEDLSLKMNELEVHLNGTKIDPPMGLLDWRLVEHSGEKGLEISVTNSLNSSGAIHGTLSFHTGVPDQSKLDIDFYAFFQH